LCSSQEINAKETIKDINGEKTIKVDRQNTTKNKGSSSRDHSNVNEHFERATRNETFEREKSSKQSIDEKRTKESTSIQHELSKDKKNSTTFSKETNYIGEVLNHTNGIKSDDIGYKQSGTNRLKRARSPSMVFDHGDSLHSKTKRLDENINSNNRELKRPNSRNEKLTRNNAFDSSKDILHCERISRRDVEISHCNKSYVDRENVERDRGSRMHFGRQDVEHERINRTHHGRKDFEQERHNRMHHGRQDIEQRHAHRIHHRRQEIEQECVNKINHGRQEFEQDCINKTHHRRHDVEKRDRSKIQDFEIGMEVNERINSRYEDSKRHYNGQEMSQESRQFVCSRELSPKSRQLNGLRDLDLEVRRFRLPQDLSPPSRQMATSQDMIEEQRLQAYDKYNLRHYDHDMKRSPEKSREVGILRSQCLEDESKGITYPKWFTAQTNTSCLGRVEGNCSTKLSVDLGNESFEKDNINFPILHGNYGNQDFSVPSQIYSSGYSDLTRDTYMDLHSPRYKTNYSNPQEMKFIQRNNYDILGVCNSPKDFNCFDVERSHANQRFGMNSLHSFDHLDGNTRRDYGINDFPQSSLISSSIPSLSKNMHEDSWRHLSQGNDLLGSYRNDINHESTTKIQDYTTSWNNIVPSPPPSSFRHSTFENPHVSSLGSSWSQPSLYSLPSTNLMPFSQRELWS